MDGIVKGVINILVFFVIVFLNGVCNIVDLLGQGDSVFRNIVYMKDQKWFICSFKLDGLKFLLYLKFLLNLFYRLI